MSLRFGYGTNGFANHRLTDALAVIADLGYDGVALTLDHDHLNPFDEGLARRVDAVAARLADLGLAVVIETGARYLLDPWHKHAPTLLHDDREHRLEFLRRAVAIGSDLGAEAVSCWSGVRPPAVDDATAWDRLISGCAEIAETAAVVGVPLGFEPEPGMLVESIADWASLHRALGSPPGFGITLDIGHCRCLEPDPVPDCVTAVASHLVNVQISDMRRGIHEHLEFGTGEIDFPPVLHALADAGYQGLVAVELPRHSHAAPATAAHSITYLRNAAIRVDQGKTRRNSGPRDGGSSLDQRELGREGLRAAVVGVPGEEWLEEAVARVGDGVGSIAGAWALAGRRCGRGALAAAPGWTAAEAARVLLLCALPPDQLVAHLEAFYREGDPAEKRAVLRALPMVPIGPEAVWLLHDAIRTNDTSLVAAALGPYSVHLDDHAWRQAVLKCVFMQIPLSTVTGLAQRIDAELVAMLASFAEERRAAGREVPADIAALLHRPLPAQGAQCASSTRTST